MPTIIRTLAALVIALTGLVAWSPLVGAGQPETSANVAQVDRVETWFCSGAADGYAPIPGLSVALTTGGGPVLVSLHLSMEGIPGVAAYLHPVIDGGDRSADDLVWSTGNVRLGDIISYQRVYSLPAGAHTFAMAISCIGSGEVVVGRGWLTVYELPSIRR